VAHDVMAHVGEVLRDHVRAARTNARARAAMTMLMEARGLAPYTMYLAMSATLNAPGFRVAVARRTACCTRRGSTKTRSLAARSWRSGP